MTSSAALGWIMATGGGMFRATPGARYPWTEDHRAARMFATEAAALAELAAAAAFSERPLSAYRLFRLTRDGLTPAPVTLGGRLIARDDAPAYLVAYEASSGDVLFRGVCAQNQGFWTPDATSAQRWPSRAFAQTHVATLAAERDRAGRVFAVEEIPTPDGPAHRALTPLELATANG